MINNNMSEKFINAAINKFNHKFDYSKVQYKNATTKVTIICPEHGNFSTTPYDFLKSKHGCRKCATNAMALQQKEATKLKLKEHMKKNHLIYEYPEHHFESIKDKIPVICKKHGIFHITVDHHLRGVGCKKCADQNKTGGYNSRWFDTEPSRKELPGMLYVIEVYSDTERFIKIGITKHSINKRYKNSPFKKYNYKVIHQVYSSLYECFLKEKEIKKSFKDHLYTPNHKFYHTESYGIDILPQILSVI